MRTEEQPSKVPVSESRRKQDGEVRRGLLQEQGPWDGTECMDGTHADGARESVKGDRGYLRSPTSFFAEHGLFSMTAANEEACQSARR